MSQQTPVMIEEHRPLLLALAYMHKARVVVEVGVAEARSTEYLCKGCNIWSGTVYGYDSWGKHGINKQFDHWSSKEQCEELLRSRGLTNFELTQIDSMTPEFHELIKTKHPKIDMAFIDGCHSYAGIKNDFDAIYPNLSDTGCIVFHDTVSIDGCREFVHDLRTKYWDGTFDIITMPYGSMIGQDGTLIDRCTGVTILEKRGYIPMGRTCDEVCNEEDRREEIYAKENAWYEEELNRAKSENK